MKNFKPTVLLVTCLAVVLTFWQLYAQEATDQKERQRQALINFAEEATNGNFDMIYQITDENYVVHSPLGDLDSDGVAGFFTALGNALTDFKYERQQMVVEGNLAGSRAIFTGIFENDFVSTMGVFPPTGEPFSLEIINIFEFDEDGEIIEEWVQFDILNFMTQLGAMGEPEAANGGLTEEVATDFIERLNAIFNTPDVSLADDLLADNYVGYLPLAPVVDREGWKAYVASFYTSFPDIQQTIPRYYIAGDTLILDLHYTGTFTGEPFFGAEATGNPWTMDGIGIVRFENGQAVEGKASLDLASLLMQTGAWVPPPTEE